MLIATKTTVAIEGEWVEAFWCSECEETKWYHVCKTGDRIYKVSLAPAELWQEVTGVIDPDGNSSVGEFTRRQSKRIGFHGVKDFGAI